MNDGNSEHENGKLRDRLSKLSDASLRITASLDLDVTLQAVIDGACSLTDARYGALLVFNDDESVGTFLASGIGYKEQQLIGSLPKAVGLLGHLRDVQKPVRLRDLTSHPASKGFPENHPEMKTFLGMPIRHHSELLGCVYLTEKEGGQEFTPEDEDAIVMFASQAAMAISNALKHRAEQRAKSDLQALLNSSPMGVLVLDAKTGGVLSLNEETRRMICGANVQGACPDHLIKMMTCRRADGREVCLAELTLDRVLKSGETVRAEEVVISLPDGPSVTALVNARPIYSDEREIVSVVVTVQDITPLQERERLRTEVLGAVSQELRTPLTTIKGSTTTVLGSPSTLDPAETQQFFRIIDEQADHIRDLMNNLRDVTQIEAGTFSIDSRPACMVDIAVEARNAFMSGEAKNRVVVDLPPDLPTVMADRQRILQVLNNLLANASKYSHEASTVRVTASQEGPRVAVTVSDEGTGVSAERLPHLFRKFAWIDDEEGKTGFEGAGLGLAVCRGIVEAHGGHVSAESGGPGFGTRITFTLPAVCEEETLAVPGPPQLPVHGRETPGRAKNCSRGRRRLPDAEVRSRRPFGRGLFPYGDREYGRCASSYPGRKAVDGLTGLGAGRQRGLRGDEEHLGNHRCANESFCPHMAGIILLREAFEPGSRRLHRQALLTKRTRGENLGSPEQKRGVRQHPDPRTLCAWRYRNQLR